MPIVTLPGGEVRDEIRQPLYDTVDFLAGQTLAGVYNFFSTIQNPVTGAPKSLAKTNMTTPGQLQTAVSFRVQGLCFDAEWSNSTAGVTTAASIILPVFLERGSLALNVGVKNYWQGPVRFACGRMLQDGISGTGNPLGILRQQFGWSAIQPVVLQGRHVIDINPLQNFLVQVKIDPADLVLTAESGFIAPVGTDISLVSSLKGLMRRPVQ